MKQGQEKLGGQPRVNGCSLVKNGGVKNGYVRGTADAHSQVRRPAGLWRGTPGPGGWPLPVPGRFSKSSMGRGGRGGSKLRGPLGEGEPCHPRGGGRKRVALNGQLCLSFALPGTVEGDAGLKLGASPRPLALGVSLSGKSSEVKEAGRPSLLSLSRPSFLPPFPDSEPRLSADFASRGSHTHAHTQKDPAPALSFYKPH